MMRWLAVRQERGTYHNRLMIATTTNVVVHHFVADLELLPGMRLQDCLPQNRGTRPGPMAERLQSWVRRGWSRLSAEGLEPSCRT